MYMFRQPHICLQIQRKLIAALILAFIFMIVEVRGWVETGRCQPQRGV